METNSLMNEEYDRARIWPTIIAENTTFLEALKAAIKGDRSKPVVKTINRLYFRPGLSPKQALENPEELHKKFVSLFKNTLYVRKKLEEFRARTGKYKSKFGETTLASGNHDASELVSAEPSTPVLNVSKCRSGVNVSKSEKRATAAQGQEDNNKGPLTFFAAWHKSVSEHVSRLGDDEHHTKAGAEDFIGAGSRLLDAFKHKAKKLGGMSLGSDEAKAVLREHLPGDESIRRVVEQSFNAVCGSYRFNAQGVSEYCNPLPELASA